MEVRSLCTLPTSSLFFHPRAGRYALAVICKATYRLLPGLAPLAPEQEPIQWKEELGRDEASAIVWRPTDLVPFKPRVDVLVVGSAFAAQRKPVRSAVARVVVGDLDKSIEVALGRASSAPLPLDAFGPVAASAPSRQEKLGARAGTFPERLDGVTLGDDFDGAYFQSAPLDQQIKSLRPDEQIVLDHLHVEQAHLVTNLPGFLPRAFVDLGAGSAIPLSLRADTLWIDTDRALMTVTFRGQVDLSKPNQLGIVYVALQEPHRILSWAEVQAKLQNAPRDSGSVSDSWLGLPHVPESSPKPALPRIVGQEAATRKHGER